jgi:glycosyltransferase involved in cell wall biosynthesis
MNILSVHNRYIYRGGEDESSELENALLRSHGHTVVAHLADNHEIGGKRLAGVGLRSIWNPASYAAIRKLIREHRIDLVKIDNFFPQISPAVFWAARAEKVPAVQALRNYRLLCPAVTLFRDGKSCEDCLGKALAWPGILHGCYRNSTLATIAPAAMATAHRLVGTWRNRVTAYVALSEFSRDKFIEGGLPRQKIFVKPNFVADSGVGGGDGNYALFVGRLTPEKGIDVLLEAWKQVGARLKLKVVGVGPLEGMVREFAKMHPGVEYLGKLPLDQTYEAMGTARALIFPSKWCETFGRTVAEAFSKGTPVIASNLGSMPAMIAARRTGLLFDPFRVESLVEQVEWMLSHPEDWRAMRLAARQRYEQLYTPERNYGMMMEIYEKVIVRTTGERLIR